MHNDVYGVTDVGLDRAIGQVHVALQYTAREPSKALPCRRGMDSRETAGVPCVEELQEIEGFSSAYFTQDDSVRPVTEGGFEEIPDGDGRQAILRLPRFETDQVVLVHVNFRGVFDEEVFPRENVVFELVGEPPLQCSRLNEVFDAKVPGVEFPDGQSHAVHTARGNDCCDAAAIREP